MLIVLACLKLTLEEGEVDERGADESRFYE